MHDATAGLPPTRPGRARRLTASGGAANDNAPRRRLAPARWLGGAVARLSSLAAAVRLELLRTR